MWKYWGALCVICREKNNAYNTNAHKMQQLNPLSDPKLQKCWLDTHKGYLLLNFFQQNFIHIILGYRWVDLNTYICHTIYLKNGYFSTGPPWQRQDWPCHKWWHCHLFPQDSCWYCRSHLLSQTMMTSLPLLPLMATKSSTMHILHQIKSNKSLAATIIA